MGLLDVFRRLFAGPDTGRGLDELAAALGVSIDELQATPIDYFTFDKPKRRGGVRQITAPHPPLKAMQRRILRRLLRRLRTHPAAIGFEPGRSIVHNALPHAGQAVVVKLDIRDFFANTHAKRLDAYFRHIGWNREASQLLTRLCTREGALPQGAPTSPRLSNLVNHKLDARLAGLGARFDAMYTRYADDMTFSLPRDDRVAVHTLIGLAQHIVEAEGYRLHTKKKLRIARRHDQQRVTGLVVNAWPALPRATRRRLRAVEHRLATGGQASMSEAQLAGWHALQSMIAKQTGEVAD